MNMTGNEFFQFTLVSASLTLSSRVKKVQRESKCKHHSCSWKSDGEVVSMGRRNGAVSNECVRIKSIYAVLNIFFEMTTTPAGLYSVHTTLRSQIFFPRLLTCSHYSFIFWYFLPQPVFLISSFVHFRESYNCSSACSPYTWIMYTSHRYSGSPTGCPLTLEFPVFACVCFNASTSSTPVCLSDLLQLNFPSWSLHSCTGIRLLPLPPCRCRTGGDCAFSRLGLLSGAHCHFTSGMQQPPKRSSWYSVVSLRPRIIWLA